jgi:hypothetical protein
MNSALFKSLGMASGLDGLNTEDPVKPRPGSSAVIPGFEGMPLYVPKDKIRPITFNDTRTINPATGMPFKEKGMKTVNVNPEKLKLIISHAKAKGIDPYNALAIAYQEQNLGSDDYDFGTVKDYFPDEDVSNSFNEIDERYANEGANVMAKAIKDKLEYAKRLGLDKKGEAFMLQAYNGLGMLKPQAGEKTKAFYGIPVGPGHPLNLRENPAYGKTVLSLRDEILKKNLELKQLIDKTPAFRANVAGSSPTASVAQ